MMYRSYADTGGNVNEEIKLLNSISHVSARLARNLSILAASKSEEGGKEMSKMAEMAQTIEELRTAAASINAAADWLYQQFSGDDEAAEASEAPAKKGTEAGTQAGGRKSRPCREVPRRSYRRGTRPAPEVRCRKALGVDPANYEALMKDAEVIGNGS
jgi:hypothetical protein